MMEVSGQEEVEHCTIVFWTYYIVRAHCRLNENDSDKGVQGVLKLVLLMEVVSLTSRRSATSPLTLCWEALDRQTRNGCAGVLS
jgi:hypothetical protein